MAKKRESIDEMIHAHLWMRAVEKRRAKRRGRAIESKSAKQTKAPKPKTPCSPGKARLSVKLEAREPAECGGRARGADGLLSNRMVCLNDAALGLAGIACARLAGIHHVAHKIVE